MKRVKMKTDACWPSFIIAGAAKSGTTSLSMLLKEHPDVYLPEREMNYFAFARDIPTLRLLNNKRIVKELEDYHSYYKFEGNTDLICGEKSVSYMYFPWTERVIRNIKEIHPNWEQLKIVIILRQPVERMYSQYLFNRNFQEKLPFEKAINVWEKRKQENWVPAYDYAGASFYSDSLTLFKENFEHLCVFLLDDLKERPEWVFGQLLDFLGARTDRLPEHPNRPYNTGGIPKKDLFGRMYGLLKGSLPAAFLKKMIPLNSQRKLQALLKSKLFYKPALDAKIKWELNKMFETDIKRLQNILDRDLSHWLKPVNT